MHIGSSVLLPAVLATLVTGAQADAAPEPVYGVTEKDGGLQFDPESTGKPIPGHVIKEGAEPWEHVPRCYTKAPHFGPQRKRIDRQTAFGEMTAAEVADLPDIKEALSVYAKGSEAIARLIPKQRGVPYDCPHCEKGRQKALKLGQREGLGLRKRTPILEKKERDGTLTADEAHLKKVLETQRKRREEKKGFVVYPDPLGQQMKCQDCGLIFPNERYPQTVTKRFITHFGKEYQIPYYVDKGSGDRHYSLSGHFWYLKVRRFSRYLDSLAKAWLHTGDEKYMDVFVAIALAFSEVYDDYLTLQGDYIAPNYIFNGIRSQSMAWLDFNANLPHLYDLTYNSKAWDRLLPDKGQGVKARHVLEDTVLSGYYRRYHAVDRNIWWVAGNLDATPAAFAYLARITGDPRHAHFAFEGIAARFQEYLGNGYDYFGPDHGNYSEFQAFHYTEARAMLEGWEDPEGYAANNSRYRYTNHLHITPADTFIWNFPALIGYCRGHDTDRWMYYNGDRSFTYSDAKTTQVEKLYEPSLLYRRLGVAAKPNLRVTNQLLGYMGKSAMSEGDDGPGTPMTLKSQRSYALLSSTIFGNHFQWYKLRLAFAANGRHIFPLDTQYNGQNTHSNGSVPYATDREIGVGQIARDNHISTIAWGSWPSLAFSTHDASAAFKDCSKIRRTVIHNTVDKKHPYVLDIIDIHAARDNNLRHGVMFQCGKEMSTRFSNGISMKPDPKKCFFKSKEANAKALEERKDALKFLNKGTSGGQTLDLQEMHTGVASRSFWMDWKFKDSQKEGARTYIVLDPREQEQGTYQAIVGLADGKNPVLAFEQRFKERGMHRTVLVSVHEPFVEGKFDRKISSVTRTSLNDGEAIGVTVKIGDREDHYVLSLDGEQTMSYNGLETDGYFAASAREGGKSDLWLYRGQSAKQGAREIRQDKGTLVGAILAVTRGGDTMGKKQDSMLVDIPLAEGEILRGQEIYVYFKREGGELLHAHPYRIQHVQKEGEHYRVFIDPAISLGFRMGKEGRIEVAGGVGTVVTQDASVVMFHQATTVPQVNCAGLRKPFYRPMEWMHDFEPRDSDAYPLPLYSNTPDAAIHYTLDNTRPTGQSAKWTPDLRLSGHQEVRAIALNPEGVVKPPVFVQEFRGLLPAVEPEGTLRPGIVFREDLRFGKGGREVRRNHGIDTAQAFRADLVLTEEKVSARTGGTNSITQYDCYLEVPESGYYTFSVQHSGHLFIDGIAISDTSHLEWAPYESEIALEAGYHHLRAIYYNRSAGMLTHWKGPGFGWRYLQDEEVSYVDALKADQDHPIQFPTPPEYIPNLGGRYQKRIIYIDPPTVNGRFLQRGMGPWSGRGEY